jgi:hypothetical protein
MIGTNGTRFEYQSSNAAQLRAKTDVSEVTQAGPREGLGRDLPQRVAPRGLWIVLSDVHRSRMLNALVLRAEKFA